jgi:hypothetical protein
MLDEFMAFELPEDIKQEYGVDLTAEIKQKIVGGNITKLYGIDTEAKRAKLENDEIAQRKRAYHAEAARNGSAPSAPPVDGPGPTAPELIER